MYPILQGYKDSVAFGLRLNFSDPIPLNRASLTVSYSPDTSLPSDERLHVDAEYLRYDWKARLRYNAGDFYDLFGPTKTSRKGWAVGLGRSKNLLFDDPRRLDLEAFAEYWYGLDTLPDRKSVV